MPSNIHKKLVFGALGCGGFVVVLGVIGLILQRSGALPNNEASKSVTPWESAAAWDSLTARSVRESLSAPAVPVFSRTPRAPGLLVILDKKGQETFPLLGDTFPPASPERNRWVQAAQRVVVRNRPPAPTEGAAPSAALILPLTLYRTRILLAAADDWSRHGDLSQALLALDSALSVGLAYLHSDDLVRIWVGARIERDAMDLLSRDTVLAGGPNAAVSAGQAVTPLDRFVTRVRTLDRWLTATGADVRYVDSLAQWVSDSALPLPVRTAAARAIAMGWVYSALEPGTGPLPARREALRHLRESNLPSAVTVVLDQGLAGMGLTQRFMAMGTYRAERLMLTQP